MKKITAAFMILCVSLTANSQDIKIKKDKISIDGTEVAILDKEKLVYKIISLDNRPIFSIERKMNSLLDGATIYYSILTDLTTNKTNEILDYGKDQGFSFQKAIVGSVCNDKYKFISAAGIDEKGVSEFINGTPTDIQKVFADANIKTREQLKAENDAMTKARVSVKNGDILQIQNVNGTDKNVVIGSVTKKSVVFISGFPASVVYEVNSLFTELDNNSREQRRMRLVGNWYATKTGFKNPNTDKNIKDELITWDNKYFPLRGSLSGTERVSDAGLEKNELSLYGDETLLASRIVAKLLYNGYTFEGMK